MNKNPDDERQALRTQKQAIENQIRRLKLMKRRKEVTNRQAADGRLFEVLNAVRMLAEGLPETLGTGLDPKVFNEVTAKWRKAIFDLLKRAANRAHEPQEAAGDE